MPQEQQQRQRPQEEPAPWNKQTSDPLGGPHAPHAQKPDTNSILKKLKAVDPKQAKKYRQRAGE